MVEPPQFPLEKLPREQHAPCGYNVAELRILNQYRIAYERQFDRERRIVMMREDILPSIFSYWEKQNKPNLTVPEVKVELVKKLMLHIRNNWRRHHHIKVSAAGKVVVRKHDLVRELWPDQVDEELRKLMDIGADEDPAAHKKYFSLLNVGISRARCNLSPAQNEELLELWIKRSTEGHPPIKQRDLFEKQGRRKIAQAAATHWLSMGALQLTFFAGKNTKGKWVLNVHDTMAKDIGVAAAPFIGMFKNQCQELQNQFYSYVRNLDNLKNPSGIPQPTDDIIARHDLQIVITPEGFPTMPPSDPTHYSNKKQLGDILRRYLNKQYNIASGGKYGSTPYGSVAQNIDAFIDKKYLPSGLPFKDPAYMSRNDILRFIEHIRTRQTAHGIPDAFRWTSYLSGQNIEDALYTGSEAAATAKRTKRTAAQKGRRAQPKKKMVQAKKKRDEEREDLTTSEEQKEVTPSDEEDGSDDDTEESEVENLSMASHVPVRRMEWPTTPRANDDPWDAVIVFNESDVQVDVETRSAITPDGQQDDAAVCNTKQKQLHNAEDDAASNGSKVANTKGKALKKSAQKRKRNEEEDADGDVSKSPSKRPALANDALTAPKTPAQKHKPTKVQKHKHNGEEEAAAAGKERLQQQALDDAEQNARMKPARRKYNQKETTRGKQPPKGLVSDDAAATAMEDAATNSSKKPSQKRKRNGEQDAATPAQLNVEASLEVREMSRICEGIGAKRVRKVKVRVD